MMTINDKHFQEACNYLATREETPAWIRTAVPSPCSYVYNDPATPQVRIETVTIETKELVKPLISQARQLEQENKELKQSLFKTLRKLSEYQRTCTYFAGLDDRLVVLSAQYDELLAEIKAKDFYK